MLEGRAKSSVFNYLGLIILLTVFCSSCHNLITGSGNIVETNFSLSNNIDEVEINGDFLVYLENDTSASYVVSGYENLVPHVNGVVEGSKLTLELAESYVFQNNNIVVHVRLPQISNIRLNSSGQVVALDSIVENSLEVTNNASGTISLFGDVNILNAYAAGSGANKLCAVTADTVNAFMIGSGLLTTNPVNHINAQITGSGQVQYLGSPTTNFSITGSGSFLQALGCY